MKARCRAGLAVAAALALAGVGPAGAAQGTSHEGHGGASHESRESRGGESHEGHAGTRHDAAQAAHPAGLLIRESKLQNRALTYRLLTWEERNAVMKGMEGMEMAGMDASGRSTHHLMLYVAGPDGRQLSGGKVGFVVTAPDKSEFKTLTMAMSGGYGADIPLRAKGQYTIRAKAVFDDTTLSEEFAYTVK